MPDRRRGSALSYHGRIDLRGSDCSMPAFEAGEACALCDACGTELVRLEEDHWECPNGPPFRTVISARGYAADVVAAIGDTR